MLPSGRMVLAAMGFSQISEAMYFSTWMPKSFSTVYPANGQRSEVALLSLASKSPSSALLDVAAPGFPGWV